MLPSVAVQAFDGKGGPVCNYAQHVKVWCLVMNLDVATRALASAPKDGPDYKRCMYVLVNLGA